MEQHDFQTYLQPQERDQTGSLGEQRLSGAVADDVQRVLPPFQSAPSGQPLDKSVGEVEELNNDEVAGVVDDDMSPSFHLDDG